MAPICHHFTENGISYGIYLLFTKLKPLANSVSARGLAEREGFEPSERSSRSHDFNRKLQSRARGCCHRGQAVEKDLMTGPPECLYNLPRLRPGLFVYNRTLMSLLQTASMKSWVCMNQY